MLEKTDADMVRHLPPLHFVTQLWGASYVQLYADYVIQSLIGKGNLPSLSSCSDAIYEIYTTEQDWKSLTNNLNFQRAVKALGDWVEFRWIEIKEKIKDPYAMMTECHRQAIKAAERRNAAILFLQPDVIVGNGSLATVRNQLLKGKRLVMSPGLRASKEKMAGLLRRYCDSGSDFCLPMRELVSHAVANMHSISKSLLWRNGHINSYCSHLYWRIDDTSLYCRCAHMHPLMVYPRQRGCGFNHTIDWDYFYRACPDVNDWFVASSSDEVCLIELSGQSKFEGMENWRASIPETVANFLTVAAEEPHHYLLGSPYLFMGQQLDFSDWNMHNREGEKVIQDAFLFNQKPTNIVSISRQTPDNIPVTEMNMPSVTIMNMPPVTIMNWFERVASWFYLTKLRLKKITKTKKLDGMVVYMPYCMVYYALRPVWRFILTLKPGSN
jgi:hypothetical protein